MKFPEIRTAFRLNFKFSNYFNQFVTYHFAVLYGFVFFKLRLKPNTITIVSLLLGLTGCYFFFKTQYIASSFLLFSSVVTDYCDGVISRITNKQTIIGKVLDILVDRTVDTFFWLVIFIEVGTEELSYLVSIAIIIISHNFINISALLENGSNEISILSPQKKWIRKVFYIPLEVDFSVLVLPILLNFGVLVSEYIFLMAFGSLLRVLYKLKKTNVHQ